MTQVVTEAEGTAVALRRVVSVGRVSEVGDRDTRTVAHQWERVSEWAPANGSRVVAEHEEVNVSGRAPLAERPGLLAAVEMVEAGEADEIVCAYSDRAFANTRVRDEVVDRVEAAGGTVRALDVGVISNATASQWYAGTTATAAHELYRRLVGEKTVDSQRDCIAEGRPIMAHIPPGYRRGERVSIRGKARYGSLVVHEEEAALILAAFKLRAGGAPFRDVARYLEDNGLRRSTSAVARMLSNRVYLGEVSFTGSKRNLTKRDAHEAIVPVELFERVQRMSAPRGRYSKSERLLARQGILHCDSCGSRMAVNHSANGKHAYYRCSNRRTCEATANVKAEWVEDTVWDAAVVKWAKAKARRGVHTPEAELAAAEDRTAMALAMLEGLQESFNPLTATDTSRRKLAEAEAALLAAREDEERLAALAPTGRKRGVSPEDLTELADRRDFLRSVVRTVKVRRDGTLSLVEFF